MILVGGEALFDLVLQDGVERAPRPPRRRPVQRGAHDRAARHSRSPTSVGSRPTASASGCRRCWPTTGSTCAASSTPTIRRRSRSPRSTTRASPATASTSAVPPRPGSSRRRRSPRCPKTCGTRTSARSDSRSSRSRAALEAVVERLAGSALIVVDPNCRPWVVDDHDAYRARCAARARPQPRAEGQRGGPRLPGARPAAGRGRARAARARARRRAAHPRAERRLVITRTAEVAVPAPRAKVRRHDRRRRRVRRRLPGVVERARAGRDALAKIDTVVEATRFACLVAARTCSRPGASPPYRHELE